MTLMSSLNSTKTSVLIDNAICSLQNMVSDFFK